MKWSFANTVHNLSDSFMVTAHRGRMMLFWSCNLHSDLSLENQTPRRCFSATIIPFVVCSVPLLLILKVRWSQHCISSSEDIKTIVKYTASPYDWSEIILNCLYILFYNWLRMVFYCCSFHAKLQMQMYWI